MILAYIVPIMTSATILVFAFTFLTRRADPNAFAMVTAILLLWTAERVVKFQVGVEAHQLLLPLTDLVGAAVAYHLGTRRPSAWIFATYVCFAVAVMMHALWFLVWQDGGVSVNKYKAVLNALYTARLIFLASPGVAYVGKMLGDYLHDRSPGHSVAWAQTRRAQR